MIEKYVPNISVSKFLQNPEVIKKYIINEIYNDVWTRSIFKRIIYTPTTNSVIMPGNGNQDFFCTEFFGKRIIITMVDLGMTVDWDDKYTKYDRWDIVARTSQIACESIRAKIRDEAKHLIKLSGALQRDIIGEEYSPLTKQLEIRGFSTCGRDGITFTFRHGMVIYTHGKICN